MKFKYSEEDDNDNSEGESEGSTIWENEVTLSHRESAKNQVGKGFDGNRDEDGDIIIIYKLEALYH